MGVDDRQDPRRLAHRELIVDDAPFRQHCFAIACRAVGAPGLVVKRRGVETQGPTGPSGRHAQSTHIPRTSLRIRSHRRAAHVHMRKRGLQSFRRITSVRGFSRTGGVHPLLPLSRSNVRSATIFFSRPFPSSSAFRHRISSGSRTPYLFGGKTVHWTLLYIRLHSN